MLKKHSDHLPETLTLKYIQLHQRIKYLKSEAIAESKALNNQLICHKILLSEQTEQLFQLKDKTTNNDLNRLGNKELREKLKLHYKENPLISQVEALKERESNKNNPSSHKVILKLPKLMKHTDESATPKSPTSPTTIRLRMTNVTNNEVDERPKRRAAGDSHNIRQSLRERSNVTPTKVTQTTSREIVKQHPPKPKPQPVIEIEEEPVIEIKAEVEEEDTHKYCFCKQGSFGNMIACDNEDSCPNGEWFHYKCVGLQNVVEALKYTVGKEKWFCSEFCRARYREALEASVEPAPPKKKKKRRW